MYNYYTCWSQAFNIQGVFLNLAVFPRPPNHQIKNPAKCSRYRVYGVSHTSYIHTCHVLCMPDLVLYILACKSHLTYHNLRSIMCYYYGYIIITSTAIDSRMAARSMIFKNAHHLSLNSRHCMCKDKTCQ